MRATNFTDPRHRMHAIWPQRHTRTPAVAAAGDHRTWAVELVSVAVLLLVLLAWRQHDGRTTAATGFITWRPGQLGVRSTARAVDAEAVEETVPRLAALEP